MLRYWPCPTSKSIWRSFVTISSGLCCFALFRCIRRSELEHLIDTFAALSFALRSINVIEQSIRKSERRFLVEVDVARSGQM